MFKPITSKLDDVVLSNLKLPALKRGKKREVTDYGIPTGDDEDNPDYGLDNLFDEEGIPPQNNKQLAPKPPTYEKSFADKLKEGKQIYVDRQYLPRLPEDLPPNMMRMKSLTMPSMKKTELM